MRIVVFGATGAIGKHIVKQALERGHTVTAVARNPASITLSHPQLLVIRGDVYQYDQVEDAIRNQDIILSALGSKTPKQVDPITSTGVQHMLRAMQKTGVRALVAISSIGVGDPNEYPWWVRLLLIDLLFKKTAPHQLADINAMERELLQSKLDWVIVRPTTLTNGPRRGRYHISTDSKRGIRFYISRADVADMMLNLAETGAHKREILHVGY